MKLRSRRTSHQKVGERFVSKLSTKKVTDPGNYRPICSLPVLYKLFATVLYARLAPCLHKIQPPDKAGFRPNHRCEDHLTVYRILEQRCREWGVPLYISTIDFTKAFDRIKHSALWSSLRYYGVKPAHVRLLQRLYNHQKGTVLTDKESDVFPIKRGTKLVDPLSSLLFNTVLQYSLENDLKRWQEKQKRIRLSDKTEDCLTNLRFADDVLLFSTSLEKLLKCYVNSRTARTQWVWESTRTKRKDLVTRTK